MFFRGLGHRSPCLWLCSQPTEPYICWKALLKSFLKIQGALSRDEVHRNSDRRRETKNGSLRLAAERFSTSGTSAPFATCTSVHDRYFCMCFLCLNAQRIPPKSDSSRQSRRCWLHHNQHDRTRQKRTAMFALRAPMFGRGIHGTARFTSQVAVIGQPASPSHLVASGGRESERSRDSV